MENGRKEKQKILINSYYGVRFDVKGNPIKKHRKPPEGETLGNDIQRKTQLRSPY
jgi:hypothetical protein